MTAATTHSDDREYGPQSVRLLYTTRREFHRVWPWLEKAVERGGPTHTKDGVWERIANGDCQLWTEPKAAVVTTVETYRDTGFREVQCWLAGGKMADARRIERRISEWAASIGVGRILIAGRRGWLRALRGYNEHLTTIAKDLT